MSPSSGKERRNTLHFIRAILILFVFQIWFVLAETNFQGTSDDTNEALLQQLRTISGMLPPGKYNRKEVTVLAINNPPTFTYKQLKGGNYTFAGVFKHHLENIFEYLNMSIKYVIIDQALVTKYGLYEATYQYLDKNEVDFSPAPYYHILESSKHMELVTPLEMDFTTILQPYPDEENRIGVTLKPFSLPVWFCLLVTTVVFVSVSGIIIKNRWDITHSNSTRLSIGQAVYNQMDYVIRHLTNQGNSGSHARTRSSFKILTGIWLLSVVVIINAYSGVLTSILTVPIFKPIAKTLKDVAESKELRVTCENNSYMSILFLNATKGYEKILGDQLRKEPFLLVPNSISARDNVINHKAAYPATAGLNNFFLNDDKKRNDHCRLTVSPQLIAYPSKAYQFGLPIGSPYAKIYSKVELLMWDHGIIEYGRKAFKPTKECRVDKPLVTTTRTLTLFDLSPAFFILGVGLSLSAFCFMMEIFTKHVLIFAQRRI